VHRPHCHTGAWGKKLLGGDGAIVATEGSMGGLYRLVPARTELEVGSERCQWAHFASCMTVMVWICANWWYILSTPSTVGEGKALEVLVTAAPVWPPSRLAEGATSLA
jgi:hypothetical protein